MTTFPDPKTIDYKDLTEKLKIISSRQYDQIEGWRWFYPILELVDILKLPKYPTVTDPFDEDYGRIISKKCAVVVDEIADILKEFGFFRRY